MKKILLSFAFLAAALTLSIGGTAFAESTVSADYGRDALIKSGDWLALSKTHPIAALSSDTVPELSDEAIEKLASWWDYFDDPVMTKLIALSLRENRSRMEALRATLAQSRALLGTERASFLPWLSTTNYWSTNRTPSPKTMGENTKIMRLGIDASWEIDIFGGTRAKVKSKTLTVEANREMIADACITLAAETAMNYISYRTLCQRLDVARENYLLQKDTVDIQQSRVDAGLSDALALREAQYTMERTLAAIPEIEKAIEETKNAIAVITGQVPGELDALLAEKKPIPTLPERKFIGIPAETLRRRPDIRAAELRIKAQMATTEATRAELYPKFVLTGVIGTEWDSSDMLFEGPAKLYDFMPKISWPIFQAGAIRNRIKASKAIERQLVAEYEQKVIEAAGEVRNALAANIKEYERNAALKKGEEAARDAVYLAKDKYETGLVDFTSVINAQQSLASFSELYATSMGTISTNAVMLFKALGGGWETFEAAAAEIDAAEKAALKNSKNNKKLKEVPALQNMNTAD
ncbi:MAG: efflux transporter outer membrane subunit [Synergistes sp.]|nr:efflux transporter outer membrane subunit [Synergistes sp.]